MHHFYLLATLLFFSRFQATHALDFPFCIKEYFPSKKNCLPFIKYHRNPKNNLSSAKLANWKYSNFRSQRVRLLTEQIVNVFEHGELASEYELCEELMDLRGYTCGKIGFTTGTNDALLVVERYTKVQKNNLFKKYIPELRRLSKLPWDGSSNRGDVSRLKGFPETWKKASCTDRRFLKAQDQVEEELYLIPSLKLAYWHKVTSELGKAIFFDTAIQHGWEEDDGMSLNSIIRLTGPRINIPEHVYLQKLINTRWKLLCCTSDDVWPESADRTADLMRLVKNSGNLNLDKPVELRAYGRIASGIPSKNTGNCSNTHVPLVEQNGGSSEIIWNEFI